jgi:hypothetical protein
LSGILWAVLAQPVPVQPLYPNGKPHHVTLQYGVNRADWQHLIGLPITLGVSALAFDDRIQAIKVILPTWVECQNEHPHVTVSWVDGVCPARANRMLAGEHEEISLGVDHLHARIEWLEQ